MPGELMEVQLEQTSEAFGVKAISGVIFRTPLVDWL